MACRFPPATRRGRRRRRAGKPCASAPWRRWARRPGLPGTRSCRSGTVRHRRAEPGRAQVAAVPFAPRWSWPLLMMPAPMPVATLMNRRFRPRASAPCPVAQRHDVHVVVHQDRNREGPLDVTDDVESVPAGHNRRLHRHAGGVFHGPGSPIPAPARSPVPRSASSSRARPRSLPCPGQPPGRPRRPAPAVAPPGFPLRSVTAIITWVAPTSTARTARAAGLKASATAACRRWVWPPRPGQQAGRDQRIDAGGDGGAGQPRGQRQFRAGPGLPVAQELKEVTGAGPGAAAARAAGSVRDLSLS